METWILIITIIVGGWSGDATIKEIGFGSVEACNIAAEDIKNEWSKARNIFVVASCYRKK